jgi:hypothetical protein
MTGSADDAAKVGAPRYSDIGAGNRDLFLGYRNAILCYCEDEGFEEFYLRLVRRALRGVYVEDVFCLGGKGKLKVRLREKRDSDKKRIFIFDKDFDDLLGTVEGAAEVVYLPRYSIENFFIEEELITEFILDIKRRVRRAEVSGVLDFSQRLDRFLAWYPDLCRHFVISMRYRLGVPGPKLEVWNFCQPDGTRNEQWYETFLESFREKVRQKQAWLLEDGRLEAELADAFVPRPGSENTSDGSEWCHLPGKHLLDFALGPAIDHYELDGADEGAPYSFLMRSVERVDQAVLDVIGDRVAESLR